MVAELRRGTTPLPARLITALAILGVIAGCSTAPRQPKEVVDKKNRAAEYTDFGNKAYVEGDYRAALTFFQQALATNLSVDNGTGVVQSLSSIGKVHMAVGQLPEAEEVFLRAARLAGTAANPALEVQCAINLGELYMEKDRASEARDLLTNGLSHQSALAGTRDLAVLYHALAVAEKKLGNLDDAQRHVELALAINRKLNAAEEVASNYYLLASIFSKREDYPQALQFAAKALETDKGVENSLGIAQDLYALGTISSRLGRDKDAFDYFERSYGIYTAMGHAGGLRSVLPSLVEIGRRIGRNVEAEAYAAELKALETK